MSNAFGVMIFMRLHAEGVAYPAYVTPTNSSPTATHPNPLPRVGGGRKDD